MTRARRPAARDRAHPEIADAGPDAHRHTATRTATDDGSVFFRIASWPAYGRLARLDPDAMRVGERVEADEYDKDDVRDFALWKGPKPGEPSLGHRRGAGAARLAHRVLRDEHDAARRDASTSTPAAWTSCSRTTRTRSPRARPRPASRSSRPGCTARTCDGRREDVEVARATSRASSDLVARGRLAASAALRAALRPLPGAAQLVGRSLPAAAAAVERIDALLTALAAYREDRDDDPDAAGGAGRGRGPGSRPASTTTSTCPRHWPRCSTGSASSTGGSTPGCSRPPTPSARPAVIRDLDAVLGVAGPAEATLEPGSRRCSTIGLPPGPRATGPRIRPAARRAARAGRRRGGHA